MAKDITKENYSEWLEGFLRAVSENDPDCMAVLIKPKNPRPGCEIMTGYWNCSVNDKALFATHLELDTVFGMTLANADIIADRAEEMRNDEQQEEGD